MFQIKQSGREQIQLSSAFCSILALSGWDNTHPHWEGPSPLLSPPVQMLISSRNTLTDTPRDNV